MGGARFLLILAPDRHKELDVRCALLVGVVGDKHADLSRARVGRRLKPECDTRLVDLDTDSRSGEATLERWAE